MALICFAALLVAGPALGGSTWPPLARALDGGFPGRTGQAGALLALVPLLTMQQLSIGMDIAIALAETIVILLAVIVGGRYLSDATDTDCAAERPGDGSTERRGERRR